MSDVETTPAGDAEGLLIDPFAFVPNQESRIRGLGGNDAPNDPSYAFHTPYIFCAPGPVTFTLRFQNLEAVIGNLTVRINALASAPGSAARSVKMLSKPLDELAESGGVVTISCEAKAGVRFAVQGMIYGPCDATATSMSVLLDRPDDGTSAAEQVVQSQYTSFGNKIAIGTSQLLLHDPATLAYPVSQMCTERQFDEPVYDQWIAAMGLAKTRDRRQWEWAYILQTLSSYGMIEPGARGVGFGVGREPLPAVLAARGCTIVASDLPAGDPRAAPWQAIDSHAADREALRRPDLCPDDRFDEAVSFVPADMIVIPAELRDFDFCWAAGALGRLGSISAGLAFIANSLQCLKIGGIGVFTADYNLSSNGQTVDRESVVLFRQQDFERQAIQLVSHGHAVAQFKYDQRDNPVIQPVDLSAFPQDHALALALDMFVVTSFGIIIQKGEQM